MFLCHQSLSCDLNMYLQRILFTSSASLWLCMFRYWSSAEWMFSCMWFQLHTGHIWPSILHLRSVIGLTWIIQSTLSKVDTLRTKATVRFREMSALERAHVTWYPNLQTETRAHSQCTMITWQTGCVSFSRPNRTQHRSYELQTN